MFKKQIEEWLKAGIMTNATENERSEYKANKAGTPQGGVISPLLCNIALHGMETEVLNHFGRDRVKIIRYADDFVITGRRLDDIKKAKEIVKSFLATVNLSLSEEKTRIGHSLIPIEENDNKVGLDFLGYHFRNVATSKHRGVKSTRGVKQEFIQISSPSKDSMMNQKKAIKLILSKYKNAPREAVIKKLAERIQG